MSTTGQHFESTPASRDPRAMSEDEWRASLPSFGQQMGTGLGQTSSASIVPPPATPFSAQRANWSAGPTASGTRWVWWIALLLHLVIIAVIFAAVLLQGTMLEATVQSYNDLWTLLAGWLLAMLVLPVVQAAVTIALAYGDRRALQRLGHSRTASPWWNLLGPLIYLVVRTVHVKAATGRGIAPLVTYICVWIVPGIVLGLLPFFVPAS